MIAILDYGLGNVLSVQSAYRELGIKTTLITKSAELNDDVLGLVIPGVGSFGEGISCLKKSGWFDFFKSNGDEGLPVLGICLGMQMLFTGSEENKSVNGLDLIEGNIRLLPKGKTPIPNMGWCQVFNQVNSILLNELSQSKFYHVHSYAYLHPPNVGDSFIDFNGKQVIVSVNRKNIFGLQFHPEKSLNQGLIALNNFYNYCLNENNS